MTQEERRIYLIHKLLQEQQEYTMIEIPSNVQKQKVFLRALLNTRIPKAADWDFLAIQNEYLQEEINRKGITDIASLHPVQNQIYLWQGDITTLRCDAIVNAANSQMLGCFHPNHGCIDNAIHTYSGVQLRLACVELMKQQGHEEAAGTAKITPAFNLPSNYVLHTVGPIVSGLPKPRDKELLAACYRSCLTLAEANNVKSIAFCCISTGEFHFPNNMAAEIAVQTVKKYKTQTGSEMAVIFNVFKENDYGIYKKLLETN